MNETEVSPGAETQNPAPEQAVTPEVAIPETAQQDEPQETPEQQAERASKGLLRRIDRLTAAKYQEQARAQQLATEAEQLRQRLAQYEQPQEGQPEALTPERVLPLAKQIAQQMREQERLVQTTQSLLSKGRAIEGFDAACGLVNEVVGLVDEHQQLTPFARIVYECDAPEKVLHYLGTNQDVLEELAGLSPTQVARRLDRIERKLSEPAEPKTSTAPKPISPVRGNSRDVGDLRDDLPLDEWNKRFNKMRRGG